MGKTLDDIFSTPTPAAEITTILVDGDIICYTAGHKTDGKMYTLKDQEGTWKYKKDVIKYCNENELSIGDIQLEYSPEPLSHALGVVDSMLKGINNAISKKVGRYIPEVYLTNSEDNFRLNINPQYKANRIGVRKPHHLLACKEHLIQKYNAKYADGMEADDELTIRATELESEGKLYVIASIDKDLKQMHGYHYDWNKRKYWYVRPEEGRELLWGQVVSGDSVDNIYSPAGVGPAKAVKLFKDVDWKTIGDLELFKMVADLYSEFLIKKGTKDCTDVMCWVQETYKQVFLLRKRERG